MRISKATFLAVVPLALFGCAVAQPSFAGNTKPSAAPKPKVAARAQTSPCWDKLGLTDKQKAALKAINEKYRLKMTELRKSKQTETQKKAAFTKLADARKAETGKVLTKAQQQKLAECMKARKQQKKQAPAGSGGARKKAGASK